MKNLIGENKKKIYTIPEGKYIGTWAGYFCWIIKDGEIFERFQTKTGMRGTVRVKVHIENTKAKIYDSQSII